MLNDIAPPAGHLREYTGVMYNHTPHPLHHTNPTPPGRVEREKRSWARDPITANPVSHLTPAPNGRAYIGT